MRPDLSGAESISRLPGFLLRRCNQIFLAIFAEETDGLELTPAQFGALSIIAREPGLDQTTLTDRLALDRSSVTKCVERLEERGMVSRTVCPQDKRVRLLRLTPAGAALLEAAQDGARRTQQRILAPLAPDDAARFLTAMETIATVLNETSRVPLRLRE